MARDTIHIRAPKDTIHRLRVRFPGQPDKNLIRMLEQTSPLTSNIGLREILLSERQRINYEKKKQKR